MMSSDENIAVEECRLHVFGGSFCISGKIWRCRDSVERDDGEEDVRVIAYPGWLDNAGSFDTLAPAIIRLIKRSIGGCSVSVCAVDPPGCGHSDHLPNMSFYSDVEEALVIVDIANALGWDTYTLLGHSRGGGIVAVASGIFPERTDAVITLDSNISLSGLFPKHMGMSTPQLTRECWKRAQKNFVRKATVFPTFEAAVDASASNPFFPKTRESARCIVRRHLVPCKGGWTFTHDVRTYGQNQPLHISEGQLREYIREIEAPVLMIFAAGSREFWDDVTDDYKKMVAERLDLIKDLTSVEVDGTHHVHLDDGERVAGAIVPWIVRAKNISPRSSAAAGSISGACPSSRL